jgi:DNA-binding transcriptional regulator YiaG
MNTSIVAKVDWSALGNGQTLPPKRVRTIRSDLGWTLKEMARVLGTTLTSVHRWEAGHHACRGPCAVILRFLGRNAEILNENPELLDHVGESE